LFLDHLAEQALVMETNLSDLKKDFGRNKVIPKAYESVILKALSHYPELKNVRINFEFKSEHPVPYGTTPSFKSIFKKPEWRTYIVSFLTEAKGPMNKALFHNLPQEAQIGIVGHELAHVVQYNNCKTTTLLKAFLFFPLIRKVMEQDADRQTIRRGLGLELYKWATYIRTIPGYLKQRPQINIYYLTPHEIMNYIRSGGAMNVVR
jgi:hypothetical protein